MESTGQRTKAAPERLSCCCVRFSLLFVQIRTLDRMGGCCSSKRDEQEETALSPTQTNPVKEGEMEGKRELSALLFE